MEKVEQKIRRLIRYYERIAGTRNPISIANHAGITIARMPLGEISGNYMLIKRKRWIFVNEDIPTDSPIYLVVIAHELGHALLHRKENCAFLRHKTLLLTSGIEREANQFAACLLISDDTLQAYAGCTEDQFCSCTGYPKELIHLRMKFK